MTLTDFVLSLQPIHQHLSMKKLFYTLTALLFMAFPALAQEKYAVLINGGDFRRPDMNLEDYWNRGDVQPEPYNEFWNDTYLMWELLRNKGFHNDNIFVLFHDGVDRRPDNSRYTTSETITDDKANTNTVQALFEDLRNGTNNRPRITEDDFLFVWVFGHGGGGEGANASICFYNGNLVDTVFASLLNPIPAHRKAFWMQQCHGGGFADDLAAPNTVFISASQEDQSAYVADNMEPSGSAFTENEPYNATTYYHGEFNFHMISVVNQESPISQNHYANEPYANADTNSDGFISMNEAYLWDELHDSRLTELYNHTDEFEDPVYDDSGNIGGNMTFDYPTLLFDHVGNNETHRGIIGISKDLVVANGQTLTFTGNSRVTLCNAARLVVEEGASLVIDGDVRFNGTNDNLLEMHGTLIQNSGSSLRFSNMRVVSDAAEFAVTGAIFTNTELKYCPAGSSPIGGNSTLFGNASIKNCQFHNPAKAYAVLVENSLDFYISGNTVTSCVGNGISIHNSGNVTSSNSLRRTISSNNISGCGDAGLVFYASTGSMFLNHIHENGIGVKLLNRCNVLRFNGDCTASSATQTQFIHDNDSYEIYMTSNCNPLIMDYNAIHKSDAGNTPFVYYDNTVGFSGPSQDGRTSIDIAKNEWGSNFHPDTHLYSTSDEIGFVHLPHWGFNDCSGWQQPGHRLLSSADSLCDAQEYDAAKLLYRQVIEEFPSTVSAEAALRALLPLEGLAGDDYGTLKQYYLTDTLIASSETLSNLASHLGNRCDEILARYDEAIAWYEGIITNPETAYADSIFATIDLGNLYLEMEGNGAKAIGKLAQFKPESRPAFQAQCEYALSLLPKQQKHQNALMDEREDPLPFWVDTIVSQPEGYVVDAEGNVEISSSDGLVWLVSEVNGLNGCEPDNFDGRTVRLANDIDFGDIGWSYRFTPIGSRETPFKGTFDGNGHRIHNLRVQYLPNEGVDYFIDMGIFGYIRHATVKNVCIDSTCMIGSSCNYPEYYRGGLVGFADSLSIVDNCSIHCFRIGFRRGGGIIGMNRNSIVRNCGFGGRNGGYHFNAGIEGAGLVSYNRSEGGYADAVVENCYFHGVLYNSYSGQYLAGLVCINETNPNGNGKRAIVRNCHSSPTNGFYAPKYGTLAAINTEGSLISNCYSDLTEMYQFQNMVGVNYGEMADCIKYRNSNGMGLLYSPVTVNGTTTDNLLDALNLWIEEQEHPEYYKTWAMLTDTVPVFGDYYVGIQENEAMPEEMALLYPNPTTGLVQVFGQGLKQAEVTNALGQRVVTAKGEGDQMTIDIAHLPTGLYFVSITDEQGRKCVRKVVKE